MKSSSFRRTFPITKPTLCPKNIRSRTLSFMSVPIKRGEILCTFTMASAMFLPRCRGFWSDPCIVIRVRKPTIIPKTTYAPTHVNAVVFPIVPSYPGIAALTVTECPKVKRVSIYTKSQKI